MHISSIYTVCRSNFMLVWSICQGVSMYAVAAVHLLLSAGHMAWQTCYCGAFTSFFFAQVEDDILWTFWRVVWQCVTVCHVTASCMSQTHSQSCDRMAGVRSVCTTLSSAVKSLSGISGLHTRKLVSSAITFVNKLWIITVGHVSLVNIAGCRYVKFINIDSILYCWKYLGYACTCSISR